MEYGSRKKDIDIYYKALKFVKQTDKSTQNRVISTYITMR